MNNIVSFNMKKIMILGLTALIVASCGMEEVDLYDQGLIDKRDAYANGEKLFGSIDPEQDWNSIVSGSVTVTADAPLNEIVKVQILTESPFMNLDAYVLAEAKAGKGEKVTLKFDAPQDLKRLVAACVDGQGNYYIKGFNIEETSVSFKKSAFSRAFTRATSQPNLSSVQLDANNSFLSFNAGRAMSTDPDFSAWKNKNWENDRLWVASGPTSLGSNWMMSNSTIYTTATPLDADDQAELDIVFNTSLFRDDPKAIRGNRDNLSLLREGNAVKFFNSHLVSNGQTPLTLIPVQLASTEAYWCDIYYYYYKQSDIPAGVFETEYIKSLPKFKAIDLNFERTAFKEKTNIELDKRDATFMSLHEYLLPFYGDASDFVSVPQMLSHLGYKADTNFYRIHNASEGKNNYFTYGGPGENLKDAYKEDVEKQLWQVFTNDSDPNNVKVMLYNVYAKQFLFYNKAETKNVLYIKDIDSNNLDKFCFRICSNNNGKQTDSRTNIYIFENGKSQCMKSVSGEWIGTGGKSTGATRLWSFEKYEGSSATAITDFEMPANLFPPACANIPQPKAVIPEGYRIGFMIRKDKGTTTYDDNALKNDKYGCLYSCGELNKEINTFGQFKTSTTDYSMNVDDPRMATFTANGKTYLCFEEGADTQYSDVILQIGGVSTTQLNKALAEDPDVSSRRLAVFSDEYGEGQSAVYSYEELAEDRTQPMAYTMCFEDRLNTADYDLNDVVLRCIRRDATTLQLTLVATGANDTVYIRGAKGWLYNDMEVHEIFYATEPDANGNRFVNTEVNGVHLDPMAAFVKVASTVSIPEYLSNIYIENMTTGKTIGLPSKGEPPYAIIVPQEFCYPMEKTPVTKTYTTFLNWAKDANTSKDWYLNAETDKLFPSLFKKW